MAQGTHEDLGRSVRCIETKKVSGSEGRGNMVEEAVEVPVDLREEGIKGVEVNQLKNLVVTSAGERPAPVRYTHICGKILKSERLSRRHACHGGSTLAGRREMQRDSKRNRSDDLPRYLT